MRRVREGVVLAVLGAVLSACASGGAASSDPEVTVRRADRNTLTAVELDQSGAQSARQAIELLRPQWLQARGPANWGVAGQQGDRLMVYVDNQRVGDASELENIRVSEIETMRYLGGPEATNRYGSGHTVGAIVITRRKG